MVPALFATSRIAPSRLQVPTRIRADPNVGPRRWNYQRPDAPQDITGPNRFAFGVEIPEAFSSLLPPDSRLRVGDIPQACFLCRKSRIGQNVWQAFLLQCS
jgi:hypothetical protein